MRMTRVKWTNQCLMRDCSHIQYSRRLTFSRTGGRLAMLSALYFSDNIKRTTHVPVGEDQQQHLELCRDLADIFNRTFSPSMFPLPACILSEEFILYINISCTNLRQVLLSAFCLSGIHLRKCPSQTQMSALEYSFLTPMSKFALKSVGQ